MDDAQSSSHEPQARLFIACPRSGSAPLLRIFGESPVCALTTSQLDEPIFSNPSHHRNLVDAASAGKAFLICGAEICGDNQKDQCLHVLMSNPSTYEMARPVVLIRDPVRVFDSWKSVGWKNIEKFLHCFSKILRALDQAPLNLASYVVYEQLIGNPREEIERICVRWGVPFSHSMLTLTKPPGPSLFFASEQERKIHSDPPLDLRQNTQPISCTQEDERSHGLLSNDEVDTIEQHLGKRYLRCWKDDVLRIRETLLAKTWFGFDLDDTLHEFRYASGRAIIAVLDAIHDQFGTPLPELRHRYAKVLKIGTENAFSDGKSSFDYRRERFAAVLSHFHLSADDQAMARLLDIYEDTLTKSLQRKCGTISLMRLVKRLGKKVAIITEGPQDAQERTIKTLAINGYVDELVTTNQFQAAKTSGLFGKVLSHLRILPQNLAYVGDSWLRDMVPAMAEGIYCIHLDETKNVSLSTSPPSINTLRKLEYILADEHASE